jgi:hypothetical protein
MKLIIFVHTCEKYEDVRAKLIENTWGSENPDVVFITDNEKSQLKNHICIGPYKTGCTYHPENVIKMFRLFYTKYGDYDFFMMIDDDSYLYIEKLKQFLSFFDKNQTYMIGDFLNWPDIHKDYKNGGDYVWWVGGGPGIVFTKSSIVEFLSLQQKFNHHYCNHDMWLHGLYTLSNKKIKRVHCPGFHQFGEEKLLKTIPRESNSLISVHLNGRMNLMEKFHM